MVTISTRRSPRIRRLSSFEIGQAIWGQPGQVQGALVHPHLEPQEIVGRLLRGEGLPGPAVLGYETDGPLIDGRALLAVPDVVEVVQHERQFGPRLGLDLKEPMPVGPIGGGPLLIIDEIDVNDVIRVRLPVQRGPVLKGRIEKDEIGLPRECLAMCHSTGNDCEHKPDDRRQDMCLGAAASTPGEPDHGSLLPDCILFSFFYKPVTAREYHKCPPLTIRESKRKAAAGSQPCHCEKRSDEAIWVPKRDGSRLGALSIP